MAETAFKVQPAYRKWTVKVAGSIHICSGNTRPLFNILYLTTLCAYHHIPSVFLPLTDHLIFDSGFNDGVHIKNLTICCRTLTWPIFPSTWKVHSSIFEPYWVSWRSCFFLALFACGALQIDVLVYLQHLGGVPCWAAVVGVLMLQSWGV